MYIYLGRHARVHSTMHYELSTVICIVYVVGMVLGYSIGYSYSEQAGGWRYAYLWTCLFSTLMFCGMLYVPYSAR